MYVYTAIFARSTERSHDYRYMSQQVDEGIVSTLGRSFTVVMHAPSCITPKTHSLPLVRSDSLAWFAELDSKGIMGLPTPLFGAPPSAFLAVPGPVRLSGSWWCCHEDRKTGHRYLCRGRDIQRLRHKCKNNQAVKPMAAGQYRPCSSKVSCCFLRGSR